MDLFCANLNCNDRLGVVVPHANLLVCLCPLAVDEHLYCLCILHKYSQIHTCHHIHCKNPRVQDQTFLKSLYEEEEELRRKNRDQSIFGRLRHGVGCSCTRKAFQKVAWLILTHISGKVVHYTFKHSVF